jgi:hypothetical protein
LVGSEREGRKSVHNVGVDRDGGLTLTFRCGLFDALFLHEKVWGGHDVSMLLPYGPGFKNHRGLRTRH